jgi:hypothetical protein
MKKLIGFLLILTLPFLFFALFGLLGGQWRDVMICATFVDVIIIFAVTLIVVTEYFFD